MIKAFWFQIMLGMDIKNVVPQKSKLAVTWARRNEDDMYPEQLTRH